MLGAVLTDALVYACNMERMAREGENSAVDLLAIVEDFETYLMQPYVGECKSSGERLYPKPYGGMNAKQRLELVDHVLSVTPKNDVEMTEKAYQSGAIHLHQIREDVNDMDITDRVTAHQLKRIGTFMLALENTHSSRSFWWKVRHPIKSNAEQRDAKELRTLLNSFHPTALTRAVVLATETYKTVTVTAQSLQRLKAEPETGTVEGEKARGTEPQATNAISHIRPQGERESVSVQIEHIDGNAKTDVVKRVDETVKEREPPTKKV
jgi:hypothetical protein